MKNRVSNLPTTRIFDTNETNIITPSDSKYADGWEYLDKAFCEYFNFFWNDTSKNFHEINPFLNDFNDEITNMVSLMKAEGMSDSDFDTAQNNWFGKVMQWLSQRITTEVSDRKSAVTDTTNSLINMITSEQTARISADEALQANIDKEVSDRKSAVSSEATSRANADSALQTSINNEKTARESADNELRTYINGKTPQATSTTPGIMKLFTALGQNIDGAPTNKLLQDQLATKSNTTHNHDGRYAKGSTTEQSYSYTRLTHPSSMNLGAMEVGEIKCFKLSLTGESEEHGFGIDVKTPSTGTFIVFIGAQIITGLGLVPSNTIIAYPSSSSSNEDSTNIYKYILYRVA